MPPKGKRTTTGAKRGKTKTVKMPVVKPAKTDRDMVKKKIKKRRKEYI